jgi:hypothetical protein
LRFRELRLPAEHAISVLPEQTLLVVGLQALAVPVGIGAVSALGFLIATGHPLGGSPRIVVLVILSVVALPFFLSVLEYDVWPEWFTTLCAIIAGVAAMLTVIYHAGVTRVYIAGSLFPGGRAVGNRASPGERVCYA